MPGIVLEQPPKQNSSKLQWDQWVHKLWLYVTGSLAESVVARYQTAAGQSLANSTTTIVNFATEAFDSHDAVTVGSSWKFTAPIDGIYRITSIVTFAANATGVRQLDIYKNGASNAIIGLTPYTISTGTSTLFGGAASLDLTKGDYVDIRAWQNSGGALALISNATANVISIERVGNLP